MLTGSKPEPPNANNKDGKFLKFIIKYAIIKEIETR
jgi:hypothetical protein